MERRAGERLDQRPAEIERAQLRQREAGLVEPAERPLLEHPVALAVVQVVVEREPGGLQRLEIAADGPGRHAGPLRQVVDRQPPRRLEVAQDRPLADDFGVAGHGSVGSGRKRMLDRRRQRSASASAPELRRSVRLRSLGPTPVRSSLAGSGQAVTGVIRPASSRTLRAQPQPCCVVDRPVDSECRRRAIRRLVALTAAARRTPRVVTRRRGTPRAVIGGAAGPASAGTPRSPADRVPTRTSRVTSPSVAVGRAVGQRVVARRSRRRARVVTAAARVVVRAAPGS